MFEGTVDLAISEARKKLDFSSLKFPMYRKHVGDTIEVYRLDSIHKVISLRKDIVIGIGITLNLPEDRFVWIHSFEKECTKEEFEDYFSFVMKTVALSIQLPKDGTDKESQ